MESVAVFDTLGAMRKMASRPRARARQRTFFKEWRKFRKMTLEEAAELSGMTAGNISAMERGTQGYTQDGLEALALAYQVEPAFLINIDPKDDAIWSIWDRAKPNERNMIIELARTVVKTST